MVEKKDVIRMVHQHLFFLNCPTSTPLDFQKRSRLSRDSLWKDKRYFAMKKACFALCLKKICEGNRRRGLAKIPYLLAVCKFA